MPCVDVVTAEIREGVAWREDGKLGIGRSAKAFETDPKPRQVLRAFGFGSACAITSVVVIQLVWTCWRDG
jgi:hypothetical protein